MTEQDKVLMSAQAYPMPDCHYSHDYDRMVTELIMDRRSAYINGINDTLKLIPKIAPDGGVSHTTSMWIARDKNGELVMFTEKPIRQECGGIGRWDTFSPDGAVVIGKELFPDVTWDTEPKEIKMTLWV
jgi:hypothetical protein